VSVHYFHYFWLSVPRQRKNAAAFTKRKPLAKATPRAPRRRKSAVAWALLGRRWGIVDFLLDIGSSPPETSKNPLLNRLWNLNTKKRAVGQGAAILSQCKIPSDVIKEISKFV